MAKLNLACGPNPKEGYINHELTKFADYIDIWGDLNQKEWRFGGWKTEITSIEEILAEDIIEHLPDTLNFMNNCWKNLVYGGKLIIRTPSYDAPFAWTDPTHVKVFTIDSFDFFDPTTAYGKYNIHLTDKKWKIIKKVKTKNKNLEIEMEKI
jgi:SAM-dependent methyltransferase